MVKVCQMLYISFEKFSCYFIVFILTPAYFTFMMTNIRGTLVEILQMGKATHLFHIALSWYCFINVVGNMVMSIITDTKLRKSAPSNVADDYCEKCNLLRPPKSWHCKKCNVCILRRDHHCFIFSRCIGMYNQRYYIMYLAHLALSICYSTYYTYFFVRAKFDEHGMILSAFRIINPFLRYLINEPWSLRELYVFFMFMNLTIIIWSVGLFMFHFKNVLKGVTAHERGAEGKKVFHPKWRENIESVFGTRWHWAIFWPFVESPLKSINNDAKVH